MSKCIKHPKFKGLKKPDNECLDCLSLYLKVSQQVRAPILPTKATKSKKVYNRKKQTDHEY